MMMKKINLITENEYKKKKEEAQKQNILNYDYNIINKIED